MCGFQWLAPDIDQLLINDFMAHLCVLQLIPGR